MKPFLKTLERVFVYYFSSIGIFMLGSIILNIPLKLIFKNYNSLYDFIVGVVLLLPTLFFLFYFDGKKTKRVELKLFLSSLAVVLVLIVLITLIIGQAVYILGPTEFLDGFLPKAFIKSPINPKVAVNLTSAALMISAFLLLYTPTILVAEYIGTKQAR